MSIYAFYFTTTLLKQMGWPRRKSFINSEAVTDSIVVDMAMNQMIDWAAGLGACRPKLALQMIAWVFKDKNWEGEDAPDIQSFIEEGKKRWDKEGIKAPHEIIPNLQFAEHSKTISSKALKEPRMSHAMEQLCIDALLWGLANPERFTQWYSQENEKMQRNTKLYKRAGIDTDSYPSITQFLSESEAMLKGYEKEVDPLPPIPKRLFNDAKVLGIHVDG